MSDDIITDFFGKPVGRIKTDENGASEVTDYHGKPLGYADKTGTRTFLGQPISPQNIPGLLLSPEHNPDLKAAKEAEEKNKRLLEEFEREIERSRAQGVKEMQWQVDFNSSITSGQMDRTALYERYAKLEQQLSWEKQRVLGNMEGFKCEELKLLERMVDNFPREVRSDVRSRYKEDIERLWQSRISATEQSFEERFRSIFEEKRQSLWDLEERLVKEENEERERLRRAL